MPISAGRASAKVCFVHLCCFGKELLLLLDELRSFAFAELVDESSFEEGPVEERSGVPIVAVGVDGCPLVLCEDGCRFVGDRN